MDEKAIEVLKVEITRLEVQSGETLLVRVPDDLLGLHETAMRIHDSILPALPRGVRLLVAPLSAEFSVIASSE